MINSVIYKWFVRPSKQNACLNNGEIANINSVEPETVYILLGVLDRWNESVYNPVFDSFLAKKVQKPALVAASGTFLNFTNARYIFPFLV